MSNRSEPVHLVQDAETGERFLIYSTESGVKVEIRYDGDALWMTQAQMADLFGRDVSVISRHVANILADGELEEESNLQKMQIASGKPITLHSLDMVISVGYRVSSTQGTMFRKWATEKLVQFATKGFVVDVERLKAPEEADRFAELREIIRDIRSDEKNVYRELRSICAMCQDYDPESQSWRDFYQQTQAKLMWAVASRTPSEIIVSRADADAPNMGLQTWAHDNIRKTDSSVAKNYLTRKEITELNRLTTILLDIFEDQLDIGKLTTMADAEKLLEQQLKQLNRAVLRGGGTVKSEDAQSHAKAQYAIFSENRRLARHAEADETIASLKAAQKSISKERKRPGRPGKKRKD
ncbi:MAG: DNA-binding protein [Rhodospirillales bacterium CG15_BIG_FIL_POST_REV_8_21_14_020_66_15]|nr:MAG: DNA-binding protein [Rhodospirillales bacterium CG15_BIG_FIL_POST_REV_8_21_14_020_66_15]